ncbi:MAG: glutamate--tRNA ligase family protein [Verrucomicrobiae bacterium]|nr:glutamate--tRNA ligase family protein [Verrucomicrobiae bacterium]
MTTRVRFAPSPTGMLHIGGARTALFNWLYARHTGGVFVLRIEDTDHARNTQEAVDVIFKGLEWLGLDWDEGPSKGGNHGPYFQSQRREIYQGYVKRLMDSGRAYEDHGAIRFKFPKQVMTVPDLICGSIQIDLTPEPDMTIVRPDGSFIFHLVNVVDDIEMKITHVIRGEDHLSNTPKHLALYEAFGVPPPAFAHIPLILNRDGSKMSKRDAGAAVGEYLDKGFIPEAVRNYLCLLGWSPKDDSEIMPIEEIIRRFDFPQINRHNARFDMDKLQWMNAKYLATMPPERFNALAMPLLEKAGYLAAARAPSGEEMSPYAQKVLSLVKEKVKQLSDVVDMTVFFFKDDHPRDPEAETKTLKKAGASERLAELRSLLEKTEPWTAAQLESQFKQLAAGKGIKTAEYIHPARVAVSGRGIGPSLYHMLEVMGRDCVLRRLEKLKG